jgi:DNA repair protein RadA
MGENRASELLILFPHRKRVSASFLKVQLLLLLVSIMGVLEEIGEVDDPLLRVRGMTPQLARILRDHGYYTVEALAIEAPHILIGRVGNAAGLSLEKAQQIIREARNSTKIAFMTISELLEEERGRVFVSTGSREVDRILGGGIRTGELTGVSGPYGVGKTCLLQTAAVHTVSRGDAGAWLIDMEGAVTTTRILSIAAARELPVELVKENVLYSRWYTTDELIMGIEDGHKIIKERNVRFLGIDGFVNPFRVEFEGRENLPVRQARMNRCLRRLINYARIYNMAIILTNQVHSKPDVSYPYEVRPEVIEPPTGGHIFMYAVNNHLYLRRASKGFIATLIDSSYMPRSEAKYNITEAGLCDME